MHLGERGRRERLRGQNEPADPSDDCVGASGRLMAGGGLGLRGAPRPGRPALSQASADRAGHVVVLAGAVGQHVCGVLQLAALDQVLLSVPVGKASQRLRMLAYGCALVCAALRLVPLSARRVPLTASRVPLSLGRVPLSARRVPLSARAASARSCLGRRCSRLGRVAQRSAAVSHPPRRPFIHVCARAYTGAPGAAQMCAGDMHMCVWMDMCMYVCMCVCI